LEFRRVLFRSVDALARSAAVFDRLRAEWAEQIGADGVRAIEAGLRRVVPPAAVRLHVAGWFGPLAPWIAGRPPPRDHVAHRWPGRNAASAPEAPPHQQRGGLRVAAAGGAVG